MGSFSTASSVIKMTFCNRMSTFLYVASIFLVFPSVAQGFVGRQTQPLHTLSTKRNARSSTLLFVAGKNASNLFEESQPLTTIELKPTKALQLLEDAIAFNSSASEELILNINKMRDDGTPRDTIDVFLNELLAKGPDQPLPFWTISKRMARISRRARMASLRRTLDVTTPPLTENESNVDNREQASQRRRRALFALLRSLGNESEDGSKEPFIVRLEKRAIKAEKDDPANLRNRLPEGLETPEYDIIASAIKGGKNVEIRRYKPYSVCAVSMNKPRPTDSSKTDAKVQMPEMSGAGSFGALAGYLFGKNEASTAMKMTTPVFTSPLNEGDRQMEFVLPSNYWASVSSAPKPFADSGVTLQEKKASERAVIMFGGYAAKKEVDRRKKELVAALLKDPEWRMADEEVTVAQYNDPFTVPWKRLNEVSVAVVKR